MAKINQKAGLLGIIMGLIVLAACALSVAGLAIEEWTVYDIDTLLGEETLSVPFGDYSDQIVGEKGEKIEDMEWGEIFKDFESSESLKTVMVVFGYVAVIAVCALALLYLLKMVLNFGLMRFFVGILGIVTLAAGAVLTGVTASYCADFIGNAEIAGQSAKLVMGLGAYFSCVGTMAGGLAAVIGVARK